MSDFTSCDDCTEREYDGECLHLDCVHMTKIDYFTPKPKQKIIDLSKLVGSDIDMEFSNMATPFIHTHDIYIGKLTGFDESIENKKFYIKDTVGKHYKCRIRQDHWHSWQGGECPLPEGLKVLIRCRGGEQLERIKEHRCNWVYDTQYPFPDRDVIAFKILGTADDARYEWQKEKEE